MDENLVICIPGKWENWTEFLTTVVSANDGEFIAAGEMLFHASSKDQVQVEFYDAYEGMGEAFQYGGQGRISEETLDEVARHKSVVYLLFPMDFKAQKDRIAKFTRALAKAGGIALKLETSGVAHDWSRWFHLLESDDDFDRYSASVVLVADDDHYYSCGMHNFRLPDAQVSRDLTVSQAAELINGFNYYRLAENPALEPGHTFSLSADSPRLRLGLLEDERHGEEDLFYNPQGIWDLK